MTWQPRRRIEEAYQRALTSIINRFMEHINGVRMTDPHAVLEWLSRFFETPELKSFAESMASRMVTGLLVSSNGAWREAARESMRGREIAWLLRNEMQGGVGFVVNEIIERNAQLITTFPLSISEEITRHIANMTMEGYRPEAITKMLLGEFPDVAKSRLRLIARTESSKASTAITEARCEAMNINFYIWRTSEDQRVRKAHRKMEGVVVPWNDAPSPEKLAGEKDYGNYHAGDIFNCRCYPEPILSLSDLKWPVKVYSGGTITRMTRIQFERKWGLAHAA